jgi:hypothetical protein
MGIHGVKSVFCDAPPSQLHPLKLRNTGFTVFPLIPNLAIKPSGKTAILEEAMFWTGVVIVTWIGSLIAMLIIVVGVVLSGRNLWEP